MTSSLYKKKHMITLEIDLQRDPFSNVDQ
jgi:hypothetical protein